MKTHIVLLRTIVTLSHYCAALYGKALQALLVRLAASPFCDIVLLDTLATLSHDCAALYGKALHALSVRLGAFPFVRLCFLVLLVLFRTIVLLCMEKLYKLC